MPFTPFHFGPAACLGLPCLRRVDLPTLLLANAMVDIEPLLGLVTGWSYPLHGFLHTLLLAPLAGLAGGGLVYLLRGPLTGLLRWFRLPYAPRPFSILLGAVAGAWLHVLLDAPLYEDIQPFFPWSANPLLGLVESQTMYGLCVVGFFVALPLWWLAARRRA